MLGHLFYVLRGQTLSPRAAEEEPWAGAQESTGGSGQRLSQEGDRAQACQQWRQQSLPRTE